MAHTFSSFEGEPQVTHDELLCVIARGDPGLKARLDGVYDLFIQGARNEISSDQYFV